MRSETLYEKVETTTWGSRFLKLKSGRKVTFTDAEREAEDNWSSVVRWLSRMVKLTHAGEGTHSNFDSEDYQILFENDWDRVERFCDQLDAMAEYYRAEIEKHTQRQTKRERIAQLRNVKGRTPEETEAYLAKADQLEKEMNE
jgi:hypothetical protein